MEGALLRTVSGGYPELKSVYFKQDTQDFQDNLISLA